MSARLAADAVVALHLAFVVFVMLGGVLAWRNPALAWLHGINVVVYAMAIVRARRRRGLPPRAKSA